MKKYRRRLSFGVRMTILFAAALLVFVGGIVGLHAAGYRYIVCEKLDGTKVKFAGRVDETGEPLWGTVFFPDSARATVNRETREYEYSNGSVYAGKLSETFERTGYGTLKLKNGDVYTGEFREDLLCGTGTYVFANGDSYTGDFVDNVKQGTGKYVYADGETYEGEFFGDIRHGTGKMTKPDGSSYEGGYEMGLKWGTGVCVYANGDRYEGEFSYDMRNGQGTYTWADGERYEGEFLNNNINGYGTYVWTGGRASYTGYFENGEIVLVEPDNPAQIRSTEGQS